MARGLQRPRAARMGGLQATTTFPAPAPVHQGIRPEYDPQGRLITAAGHGRPSVLAGTDSKGNPGEWHTYGDGRRVFVARKPAAPAPAAPAPAAAPAAPAAPQAAPDPRDSTYMNEAAGILADVLGRRQQFTLAGQRAAQDYATANQRREVNRQETLRGTDLNANAQGLLYSGTLGKRRGQVETDFNQQGDDARLAFERDNADRAAALEALGTLTADPNSPVGFSGTGEAWRRIMDAYNGGVDRATERSRTTPVDPGPDDIAPAADGLIPGPAATASPKKAPRSYVKGGWYYREASDGSGRMLRIRRATH